jgi:hypothetical protein
MDPSVRAELIRQGNAAFNEGDYQKARECFTKAQYSSGLVRIGDYYMYERRLPLLAYGYYRRAGAQAKIEDLQRRMIGAFAEWVGRDKLKPESQAMLAGRGTVSSAPNFKAGLDGQIQVNVSPILMETALKILGRK